MKKIFYAAAISILSLLTVRGNQGDTITLDLNQPSNPADSFKFVEPGRWDLTYDSTFNMFEAQIFGFSHLTGLVNYGGTSWEGFTVCNTGDTAYYGYTNAWGNMAGGGIKTDANGNIVKSNNDVVVEKTLPYIVAYYSAWVDKSLKVTFKDTTYMPLGVYIANSPYAYHENNGNATGYGRALNQEGDFFKLTFHGLDADNNETGTTAEHFLAKFEDGVLKQSNKWEWVDLSALGKISSFYCTLSSSDNGQYGMNTAAYFCMDKLQVAKPLPARNEQAIAASQVKVYPTTTSNLIYISANGIALAGSKAMIYDMQGRKLQEVSLSSSTTKTDISNYNTGMYIVKIGNQTAKIIKR
jgi:hypothetical protein